MTLRPVVLMLALATFPAVAQRSPCDPLLVQPPGNPNGYRQRGDRCEGVYVQQVSGEPLAVVSWTRSLEDYDLTVAKPLVLAWDSPGGDRVHLRAGGLRRRLYYRMDAAPPARSRSYSWPASLLAALGIGKAELAITATVRVPVDKEEREVYLPLDVRQQQPAGRSASYQLILVPEVELKEVYLTLAAPGKAAPIKDGERLHYGFYPAGRPIEIPVTAAKARGIYRLQIGADLGAGGSSTVELWFYHPGSEEH